LALALALAATWGAGRHSTPHLFQVHFLAGHVEIRKLPSQHGQLAQLRGDAAG
jgi:hypothetical protein